MVCPYIVYHYKINKTSSHFLFPKKIISNIIYTPIERKESTVIRMIPKEIISPTMRELLYGISKYGVCTFSEYYTEILCAVNLKKNKIFIGYHNLYDSTILKYIHTNTVIFQYRSGTC